MAILVGANSGTRGAHGPSDNILCGPSLGVSVSLAISTTSANVALPTDVNGNLYAAYFFGATTPAWIQFCTANTDTITAAGPNTYLLTAASVVTPVATPQAMLNKSVGAYIAAVALTGTGYINIIGTF